MPGLLLLAVTEETFQREATAVMKRGPQFTTEVWAAIGAAVAVGAVLFLWTYLRHRKKVRNESRQRGTLSESKPARPVEIDPETGEPVRRRRKRRRRREHRPRNPTLDKTGGLPPPRPEDDLPKF